MNKRIPIIVPAKVAIRTFKLFDYLKVPKIIYYLKGPAQPSRDNDITTIETMEPEKEPVDVEFEDEKAYVDPYKVSTTHGGMIRPE